MEFSMLLPFASVELLEGGNHVCKLGSLGTDIALPRGNKKELLYKEKRKAAWNTMQLSKINLLIGAFTKGILDFFPLVNLRAVL